NGGNKKSVLFFTFKKSLFVLFSFSKVSGYFGKANMISFRIDKFCYYDTGPKDASIFTHPPAFFFKHSFFGRDLKFFLGMVSFYVVLSVENRKMLSYDFRSFIAFKTLGSGVP